MKRRSNVAKGKPKGQPVPKPAAKAPVDKAAAKAPIAKPAAKAAALKQ